MKRIALLLFFIPACADKDQPATEDRPSASAPAPAADHWTASPAQVHGDVRVTVTGAAVEPTPNGGPADLGEVFVVRLSLENTHPSRRGEYRTWAGNAILTDNFGNRYKSLTRPRGTGVTAVPLNPAAPVTDVLMFEAPMTTAGHVELVLPGVNAGVADDYHLKITLQTSGARLDAVRKAAAAQEAQAAAAAAAIKAREAAAKRKAEADRLAAEARIAERAEAEALARREAEKIKAEAAIEAERARAEAEKRRREAEIAAMPGKLASAKSALETAQGRLGKIRVANSRYTFSGAVPPADYFDASGKYIYFTSAQKTARTMDLQKEADQLTTEIADLEARIKATKP